MTRKMNNPLKRKNQRLLYSLLLIATPFLLLQNYLQSFIGQLSDFSFSFFDTNIPYIPFLVVLFCIGLAIFLRKQFTFIRVAGWIIILVMFLIGQQLTDFYFHHRFYDLQYNWHYLAYAIFSYLNYRYLKGKQVHRENILINTFLMALTISTFDEMIQIPLSNRVFDIGDVSKDVWGTMAGLTFVFWIIENGSMFQKSFQLRHKKIKDYFSDPVSISVYLMIFAFLFLAFTAVLSDTRYLFQAIVFPVLLFLFLFFLIHFSQFNQGKRVVGLVIFFILSGFIILQVNYHNRGVVPLKKHLLLYKGFPVFYLDLLVYPNGTFRPVDKKELFNQRDKRTILQLSDDILLIASGSKGDGGKGFIGDEKSNFIYNKYKNKGLQVIILKNRAAFNLYNELEKERKKVTLIVKND